MQKVFSVNQVNAYIRGLIEEDMILSDIQIKGELSNVKYHSSGHIYFTLKDSKSSMSGIMFAVNAYTLDFLLKEGQAVVVTGNIGVYERDGKYQIYAKSISREGAGLLYEKYEKLKKSLEEMGMFDEMYKQPIPQFVRTLGVVTAPTGAAVRDIINVAKRRNPFIQILLYPAQVQGDGAAQSIVNGIKALEQTEADVIIVGRGGGSIEDLWAFNEEIVARAIFDCTKPIISGTGHETDTTIADWVADLRAPTPSAAAELAVFDYYSFELTLDRYMDELNDAMDAKINSYRQRLESLKLRVEGHSSVHKLQIMRMQLKNAEDRLIRIMDDKLTSVESKVTDYEAQISSSFDNALMKVKDRFAMSITRLETLSPLSALSRGYAYVQDDGGNQISSIKQLKKGSHLEIYLKDGKVYSDVTKTEKDKFRNL